MAQVEEGGRHAPRAGGMIWMRAEEGAESERPLVLPAIRGLGRLVFTPPLSSRTRSVPPSPLCSFEKTARVRKISGFGPLSMMVGRVMYRAVARRMTLARFYCHAEPISA